MLQVSFINQEGCSIWPLLSFALQNMMSYPMFTVDRIKSFSNGKVRFVLTYLDEEHMRLTIKICKGDKLEALRSASAD